MRDGSANDRKCVFLSVLIMKVLGASRRSRRSRESGSKRLAMITVSLVLVLFNVSIAAFGYTDTFDFSLGDTASFTTGSPAEGLSYASVSNMFLNVNGEVLAVAVSIGAASFAITSRDSAEFAFESIYIDTLDDLVISGTGTTPFGPISINALTRSTLTIGANQVSTVTVASAGGATGLDVFFDDVVVTFGDTTEPNVTVDQAVVQADPTNGSPIHFTVIFDEPVTGFETGDVIVGGTANSTTGTVTGSGATYNVAVSGMSGDGTVTTTIDAGVAQDTAIIPNSSIAATSTDNEVTFDTMPPTDPVPSSSSHAVSVWDDNNDVVIEISGASDIGGSGVDGFEIEWNQSATWTPTQTKEQEETWAGATFTATPDGDWYFHIATADNAGNWTSTEHLGPFQIDTTPPSVPTGLSPASETFTNGGSPVLSWDASTDTGGSGIRASGAYRIVVRGPVNRDTYISDTDYKPTLCEGSFTWKLYARDNVGNNSAYTSDFTLMIDKTPPSFGPLNPPASTPHKTGDTFTISVDIADSESGVNDSTIFADLSELGGGIAEVYDTKAGENYRWEITLGAVSDGMKQYRIDASDNLGNAATQVDSTIRVDNTPPIDPALSSSSHAVGVWDDDDTVDIAITGASDIASGVDGFEIEWDQNVTWTPTETKEQEDTWAGATFTAMSDGDWYFHIATVDNVGNWTSTEHLGPFQIDTMAPTNPAASCTSHTVGIWSDDGYIHVSNFSSSSDTDSGVDGYEHDWSNSATWTPTGTKDMEENVLSMGSNTLWDGDWYFHIATVDNAGNWAAHNSYGPYKIDTMAPNDPSLACSSHTVGAPCNDTTIDMSCSGASDPLFSGVASGIDGFDYAWDKSPTWTATEIKDVEETWPGDAFTATSDGAWYFHLATVDNAGNWTSTEHFGPLDIDTASPNVSSVTSSDTLIADSDIPGMFTVTVVFSEDMLTDGTADPALVFNPNVAGGGAPTLINESGSWNGTTDTYTFTYDLEDNKQDEDSVTVGVTGARDVAGNPQMDYIPEHKFEIDTENPTSGSVTPNLAMIAEADVGDNTFTLTIAYSEPMVGGVLPTIAFPTVGENPAVTLTPDPASGWTDGTTYIARYDVANLDEEIDLIDVRVTGAHDLAGNVQPQADEADVFSIDTVKPSVIGVVIDTNPVYEGDPTQQVKVTFDEMVDTGTIPQIEFSHGAGWAENAGSQIWGGFGTEFTVTYTLPDNDEEFYDRTSLVDVVTVDVIGAKDEAGNDQEDYAPQTEFDIDTLQPTLIDATSASADGCYTVGTTIDITLAFSEDVRTHPFFIPDFLRLVLDSGGVRAATYHVGIDDDWLSVWHTTVSGTYTVAGDENSRDLTLLGYSAVTPSGYFDWAGNVMDYAAPPAGSSIADQKDLVVDTADPVVSVVIVTHDPVNVSCEETVTFATTVTDNCCVTPDGVTVDVTLLTANATLGMPTIHKAQNGQGQVDITGSVLVFGLTGRPATVQVTVNADDCCGNGTSQVQGTGDVIDTTDPLISGVAVSDESVDENGQATVTFSATVTDNCSVTPGGMTVDVTLSTGNATLGTPTIHKVQNGQGRVDVSGSVLVSNLSGCPATVQVTVDADDCCGNGASQAQETGGVIDEIIPVIRDLRVDEHVLVDDCCEAIVTFDGYVEDNCCIDRKDITFVVTNPTGNATMAFKRADVTFTDTEKYRVGFAGEIRVSCLTSCPAFVVVVVSASDSCGNSADTVVSIPDPTATEYNGGDVYDEIAPFTRDDPRQDVVMDERAILDSLVVVRLDRNGTYRLMIREGQTVSLDVVANDSDNCSCDSHDPCAACNDCDAVLRIHDIVEAPRYGTATIKADNQTPRSAMTTIRYAPPHAFSGWDQFSYCVADACGNLSDIATVYVEVIARSGMEDVRLTTCADVSIAFEVAATDPWKGPDDLGDRPFEFQIVGSPTHGVLSGDLSGIVTMPAAATDDGVARAIVALTYTPAEGFVGQDRMTLQCVDPFGDSSEAVISVTVEDCITEVEPPAVTVEQGVTLSMIVPQSFQSILEQSAGLVLLVSLEDGLAYPGMLTAMWDESAGQYVLLVDTQDLSPGEYLLTIPLGNGETVELRLQVGEAK